MASRSDDAGKWTRRSVITRSRFSSSKSLSFIWPSNSSALCPTTNSMHNATNSSSRNIIQPTKASACYIINLFIYYALAIFYGSTTIDYAADAVLLNSVSVPHPELAHYVSVTALISITHSQSCTGFSTHILGGCTWCWFETQLKQIKVFMQDKCQHVFKSGNSSPPSKFFYAELLIATSWWMLFNVSIQLMHTLGKM